jgi:DNA-binding NtrC family response regulator
MGLAILLVEDDLRFAATLCRFLEKEDHHVEHAATGEDGVRLFEKVQPDLVLVDLMLPGIGGMEALRQMKAVDESVGIIVMTAHGSIAGAVEAMSLGALDYLTKPIDLDALCLKLAKARQLLGLRSDLEYMLDRDRRETGFHSFIGSCPAMRVVYDRIREVARTDHTTVLVTGQTGTGKELVAQAIHALSERNKRPMMQIDCTSIPVALLESELFGHERGAFTSADRAKKGLLELADGGTLLLDEIGDMALELQSKFLRVLQERRFRRVGGTRDLHFDVRVISATNQDLAQLAKERRFREDLMFRLKVFQIDLPPLRERGDDVLELADTFVHEYARSFRKPVRGLDDDARRALLSYSFPGNVRELKNIIEQAVILTKGELVRSEVLSIPDSRPARPAPPRTPTGARELDLDGLGDAPLVAAERELIRQAMHRSGGNQKRAAELLGISRFALKRKLEKLA